ncbi:hypothetical protein CTZ27_06965 [Streptomyces griseocarneus]|nr:hypothetical protein CTZ27_06965 [Streptomyces griseocarneus]
MTAPKRLDPSQSYIARLGVMIRALRVAKGWSQAELGKAISITKTSISKFETGAKFPIREVAEALDRALDAKGKLFKVWDELNDDPSAKWVEKYFAHESKAVEIHQLADTLPALLQSDDYTRAVLQAGLVDYGGELDAKIAYRQRRRAILDRPDPPTFRALIHQSAFDRVFGDLSVMRGQLLYMLDRLTLPHVELRVIPLESNRLDPELGYTQIMVFRRGRKVVYRAGPVRDIYITNREEAAEYTTLYDRLWRGALPPEDSIAVIRKTLEEKYPCPPFDPTCP